MAEQAQKSKEKQLAGVLGYFEDATSLIQATRKVKEEGYVAFDTFTPFPVHGLDEAQGLGRSFLPFVTFGAALVGLSSGYLLQYWTSAVAWPLNVGGKPFNSIPAFVPVAFETTILFAGLATFVAMLLVNRLPNLKRKSFDPSLTNNRFAILIEAPPSREIEDDEPERVLGKPFEEEEAAEFLKKTGATATQKVFYEGWFS
jgi:hypothetical protein